MVEVDSEEIEESLGEVVPTKLEEYTGVYSPHIPLFETPIMFEKVNEEIIMSDKLEVTEETTQVEETGGAVSPIDLEKTEQVEFEPQTEVQSDWAVGRGVDLRRLLVGSGYVLKLGVTNKMIEKYAQEVFDNEIKNSNMAPEMAETADFIEMLGEYIVVINYAEKVEPIVEKVPEIKYNSPGISLQTERTEYKQDTKEDTMDIDSKRKKRLSANSRWMDRVDFSILFLRSAQWAFILVLIGVAGQAFHVYHVVSNLSDLAGWAKVVNGLLWAVFLSFGLVYFSLKLGRVSDSVKIRKYRRTVNWFIAFDVFANLYYWSFKFVLMPAVLDKFMKEFTAKDGSVFTDVDWSIVNWMTFDIAKIQWPQMIAATIFAISIPFILKAFAGEIDLPAMLDKVFRSYKEETDNE